MYLTGSLGHGAADEFSDVDVVLVARNEDYDAVKSELRSVCEAVCGPIESWLSEGETAAFCNFAFLFRADPELLLYDFGIIAASAVPTYSRDSIRILFDKTGAIPVTDDTGSPGGLTADRLQGIQDRYWVYAYLNGKYWRRSDLFKLRYVQQVLFSIHMDLLHYLHPEIREWGWWPADIKHLPASQGQALDCYFRASDPETVGAALQDELDRFAEDARTACGRWGVVYPESQERSVRDHLRRMGVLRA